MPHRPLEGKCPLPTTHQGQQTQWRERIAAWLVHELAVYLKKKYNKDIVAWDELIETKTDNYWNRHKGEVSPLIMAWNLGLDGTKRWTNWTDILAASKGFHTVIVPYNVLYLDWMQVTADQADVNEGYRGGWGRWVA